MLHKLPSPWPGKCTQRANCHAATHTPLTCVSTAYLWRSTGHVLRGRQLAHAASISSEPAATPEPTCVDVPLLAPIPAGAVGSVSPTAPEPTVRPSVGVDGAHADAAEAPGPLPATASEDAPERSRPQPSPEPSDSDVPSTSGVDTTAQAQALSGPGRGSSQVLSAGRGRGAGRNQGRGAGRGTGRGADASSNYSSGPGRGRGPGRGSGANRAPRDHPQPSTYAPPSYEPPPYAEALSSIYVWPRPQQPPYARPSFLQDYPVPEGKTFNVNSFLGRVDPHGGKYLVPQASYGRFMASYVEALGQGYQLYLTENYNQQVYKYFVELDWDWDTDLSLVMEVTPRLLRLISEVAGEFYALPFPNAITSIRTPYKVHLNFPQLLTTELLACVCRDRILDACRTKLAEYELDWERLIDFPHGSLRLMGSRKGPHMDSDPAWVADKAYHPARFVDGKWRPGGFTPALLQAASIFPSPQQVAAFERSPKYLDMVFSDMEAYKQKIEERRRRRAEKLAAGGGAAQGSGRSLNLPPGSSKLPLHVTLAVRPDETVALQIYIKSRHRTRGQQAFRGSGGMRRPDARQTPSAPSVGRTEAADAEPTEPAEGAAPDVGELGGVRQTPSAPSVAAASDTMPAALAEHAVQAVGEQLSAGQAPSLAPGAAAADAVLTAPAEGGTMLEQVGIPPAPSGALEWTDGGTGTEAQVAKHE